MATPSMATPSAEGFTLRPPRGSSPQAGGASFTPTMALHTGLAGGGDTTQVLMSGIDTPVSAWFGGYTWQQVGSPHNRFSCAGGGFFVGRPELWFVVGCLL
jgi:hypothetical protein